MSFDLEAFREQIRKEPHDPLHRQIRSVLSDVRAEQEAQPLVDASQNEAAAAWHEAAGHDLQNGVKWVAPTSTFDAYPAGAKVTHNGETWENVGTGIATGNQGSIRPGSTQRRGRASSGQEGSPARPKNKHFLTKPQSLRLGFSH